MASPNHSGQETEQELRARISAGSQKLEDYDALADLLLASPGREEEGLTVLDQALTLALSDIQKARISAEMALFLQQLNQVERAATMARRALSQLPKQAEGPDVLLIRGSSHATLANCLYPTDRGASDREATAALDSLERLLRGYPDSEDFVEASLQAAGVYMLREEYGKAVSLCEDALRRDSSERNRLSLLVGIAQGLRCQSRYAEAEVRLRETLGLVKADRRLLPRIYFELGMVQRLTNRFEEALLAFEKALAALEFSPPLRGDRDFIVEIKWELANLYYSGGKYADAILTLQEILPDLPKAYPYWDALTCLGHCYLATGQYAEARDCYREVLVAERVSDEDRAAAQEGLCNLSGTLRGAGRFPEAERTLEEALRHGETDKGILPRLYFERGMIQRATDRLSEAKQSFQEALGALQNHPVLRGDPRFLTEIHWSLGELYYESTEYREAAAAFQQVLARHPEDDPYRRNALLWAGHCYLATGSPLKARDCYEEVLASPDASEVEKASAQAGLAALPPLPRHRPH